MLHRETPIMSVTHIFKVVDGLSLEIDVLSPPTKDENTPVILHFHGGFLVSANTIPNRNPNLTSHSS
jgi:acetyl esterase/lipase